MSLEKMIATYVRDAIAKAIGARDGDTYSTESGHWPPGSRSRRAARERIRAVPGHERLGTSRATVWRVSVAAYRAHHLRPMPVVSAPVIHTDEDLADAALAGMRPTRAGGAR